MLQVSVVNLPAAKYSLKCPHAMTPSWVVVHNTANDATAMAEISYMQSNGNQVSFHFAVDDSRAVQGLPLNRNGWHAGDGGSGKGNRKGIGVEICYSKSGGARFAKAEENGAELVAMILKDYGWGPERVIKHQDCSGKYCPARTLDMGWERFLRMVKTKLAELGTNTNNGGVEHLKVLKIIGAAKGINVQGFGDFNTAAVAANGLRDGYYVVNADKVSTNEGLNWCVIYYPPLNRTLAMPYGGALADRCTLLENQEPMNVIPTVLSQAGAGGGASQVELEEATKRAAAAEADAKAAKAKITAAQKALA